MRIDKLIIIILMSTINIFAQSKGFHYSNYYLRYNQPNTFQLIGYQSDFTTNEHTGISLVAGSLVSNVDAWGNNDLLAFIATSSNRMYVSIQTALTDGEQATLSFDYFIPNSSSVNQIAATGVGGSGTWLPVFNVVKGSWQVKQSQSITLTSTMISGQQRIYFYSVASGDTIYLKNILIQQISQ